MPSSSEWPSGLSPTILSQINRPSVNGTPHLHAPTPKPAQRRHTVSISLAAPHVDHASSGLTLASVLLAGSGLFVLTTLFFGTKGGYYDTDQYDGNGTAH